MVPISVTVVAQGVFVLWRSGRMAWLSSWTQFLFSHIVRPTLCPDQLL